MGRRCSTQVLVVVGLFAAIATSGAGARQVVGDPYLQVGSNLASGSPIANGLFGISGAISGDASTAIIGAVNEGTSGDAYVFVPAGSGWTQQAQLSDPSLPTQAYMGSSVALSDNGNTALVGARNANEALVFDRSGTTWALAATIAAPAHIVGFGADVGLSGDGTTAIVGDSGATSGSNVSSAVVYHLASGSWSEQALLAPPGEASNGGGFNDMSVAIASGASTALIGNAGDAGGVGSVWVYVQSGGVWSEQGGRLSVGDEVGSGGFGGAVALSANGNVGAIGAPDDDCYDGAAYVFARSGTSWSEQSTKLTSIGLLGSCPAGGPTFGEGAALSADGTTAFFGGGDPALFTATGASWSQLQAGFAGGGQTSLSDDGQTALSTCAGCDGGQGTAYIWTFSAAPPVPAAMPSDLHVTPTPGASSARVAAHVIVSYHSSVKAKARIQVLQREAGATVNGNCTTPTAGAPACMRWVPTTYFDVNARKGANSTSLPSSALPAPGSYELRLILNRAGERRAGLAQKKFAFKG